MTRSRKSKPANLAIAMAFIVVLLLILGAYTNFFGIVQPGPGFTTWPKIAKIHLGEVYVREAFGERKIAEINHDYRPIAYDHVSRKWSEIASPSVEITKYEQLHGASIPRTVTMKPSLWQYEEKGGWFFGAEAVMFRMDPDEGDLGAPDVEIIVKPQIDQPYGGTGFRAASYDVHILIIGTSPREIPAFYKGSYVEIIFDCYYLIKSARINGAEHEAIFDDQTGKTKIILHIPSVVPEQEPGDVFILQYGLNWPPAQKVYDAKFGVDVIYDPNVVVATAEQTAHWTPTTASPTTWTRTEGTMVTETEWWTRTIYVPVTTTVYHTTYQVETMTTTVGGQPVIYTYTTTVKDAVTVTALKTTETAVTGPATVTVVETQHVTKILEETPLWVWLLIAVLIALVLGSVAMNFAASRAKARARRSRRRR